MASPLVAEEYTEENTHFARICRTIVELCRDVLWDFLCRKYKPAKDLPGEVINQKVKLEKLHRDIMKLFEEHNSNNTEPTKKELDVSSLYTIIRNLIPQSVLKPPTHKWGGKMPMEKDIMEADDIERIRRYRNELYGHITKAALSKPDYEKYKTNLRGIFSRFDRRLQGTYVQRFDDYQSCEMDPKSANDCKKLLLKQREYDEETRTMVIELKDDVEDMKGEMDQIQTSNAIQEERITAVAEKQTVDSKRIDDLEEHQKQQSGEMDQIQTSNAFQEERITAVAEKQTVDSKRIDDLEEQKKQQSGEMDQIQTSNAVHEERITAVAEKQTVDSKRIDDLEEHKKQQSGEIEQVNKDLKELKTSVEQKQTEESKRTSYMYLEERQKQQSDLQKEVIQHYQTNGYCKTAIPVLIDDEELDIQEFYLKPTMEVKQDKNSDPDYYGRTVSSIHELFPHETIRRVCIQGEAGYGKTSFCKHLISSWCKVHSGNNTGKLCEKDISFLKSLDLLFYIPLRNYEISDVNEMIKEEIVEENLHSIFTEILKQDSEKCLIILDGLDEYSFSSLPNIDIKKKYKVIFTSRPWKIESLRTKPHILGRVVQLTKMEKNDDLIKAVVESLNKKEGKQLDWKKFKYSKNERFGYGMETHQYMKIRHLAEIPVILIQMVCMWFDGEELGNTRTEIYISMLQYLFRVAEKYRSKAVQKYLSKQNIEALKQKSFKDLKIINDPFSGLIFKIADFAFHTLFNNEQGELLVFSHSDMRIDRFGLSEEDIECCLSLGILSQEKIQRKSTLQEKRLSFLHKTFHEFFSAIHAAFSRKSVLREILGRTQVSDLFRVSEILCFVVGISFSHINEISSHISGIVDTDEHILNYRMSTETRNHTVKKVQNLLFALVDDSQVDNLRGDSLIDLRDLILNQGQDREQNSLLTYLNIDSIKSLSIVDVDQLKDTRVLRILNGVKYLVKIAAEVQTQEDVDIITGIIHRSRAYLKCIVIGSPWSKTVVRFRALIDTLVSVDKLCCLSFRSVSMKHEEFKLFGQCLTQFKRLEELDLWNISCATCSHKQCTCSIHLPISEQIDLSRVKLICLDGHVLLGSLPSLKSAELKGIKIAQLDLSIFEQLRDLTLHDITCTTCKRGECCCTVDLRCNKQLNRMDFKDLNKQIRLVPLHSLEDVRLEHSKKLVHVLHQLKNFSSIKFLGLSGDKNCDYIRMYDKKEYRRNDDQQMELKGVITEILPTLPNLQALELYGIDLDDDDLIIPREMKHLEVRLGMRMGVTMTLHCVKRFIDSILQVQHTIEVGMWGVYIRPSQDTRKAVQYIRDNCHVRYGFIQGINDGHDEDDEHGKDERYIWMRFETIKRHAPAL